MKLGNFFKLSIILLALYLFSSNFSRAAEWSAPVKLTSLTGDEMFPTISPDGNQLAFVRYHDDGGNPIFDGVWLMNLKTSEQKIILTHDGLFNLCSNSGVMNFSLLEVWRLSWNPNGTEMLVSAYCPLPNKDKVVRFGSIDVLTGEVKDFKSGEHPSWSSDGNKIIYLYKHGPTVAGCQRCGKELWIMNKDGSDAHMIYNVYGDLNISAVPDCTIMINNTIVWPSFSPDDKKILFVINYYTGNSSINTINVDGSDFKQLIGGSDYNNPQFTSDGKEIIFFDSQDNETRLWSMFADGSNLKQLSSSAELKMNGLSVSPDGKTIFFPMVSEEGGFNIWKMEREEPSKTSQSKVVLYSVVIVSILIVCILFFLYVKKKY